MAVISAILRGLKENSVPRPHCALVASQRGFGHETTGMRNVIPLDIECQSPDRLVAKKHVGFSGNRETKESKACPPLCSLKN